jgi:hypothetical protein
MTKINSNLRQIAVSKQNYVLLKSLGQAGDSFIEQIFHMKRTLNFISISAIILASFAIALSIFLLRHPSFFAVLEIEHEFGLVLSILLGAIIIISAIWIVAGIKQYRSISSWGKRYEEYVKHKKALDKKLASEYDLHYDQ